MVLAGLLGMLGRRTRAAMALLLMTASWAGVPAVTRAHDPPAGWGLVFTSPDAPMPGLVVSNRGLVFLDDQLGPALHLRCDESYRAPAAEVPSVMTNGGGELMLALYHGVYITSDGACTLETGTGLPDATLGAVVETSDARLVTSGLADAGDAVFESLDQGASWTVRHDNPAGQYFDFLIAHPSDRRHLYAQAFAGGARSCAYSSDSGRTFEVRAPLPGAVLLAVHPGRPEVVFAHSDNPDSAGEYALLRSIDGCDSFQQVLTLPAPPTSLAAGMLDGELWLGTPTSGALSGGTSTTLPAGLYRSENDGADFASVKPDSILGVTCLAQRGQRLFACATVAPNRTGVWYSDDGFMTRTTLMTFADVTQPLACENPADRAVCAGPWYDFSSEKALTAAADPASESDDEQAVGQDEGLTAGQGAGDTDDGSDDGEGSAATDDGRGTEEEEDDGTEPADPRQDGGTEPDPDGSVVGEHMADAGQPGERDARDGGLKRNSGTDGEASEERSETETDAASNRGCRVSTSAPGVVTGHGLLPLVGLMLAWRRRKWRPVSRANVGCAGPVYDGRR